MSDYSPHPQITELQFIMLAKIRTFWLASLKFLTKIERTLTWNCKKKDQQLNLGLNVIWREAGDLDL
jgi:hypothetical protein